MRLQTSQCSTVILWSDCWYCCHCMVRFLVLRSLYGQISGITATVWSLTSQGFFFFFFQPRGLHTDWNAASPCWTGQILFCMYPALRKSSKTITMNQCEVHWNICVVTVKQDSETTLAGKTIRPCFLYYNTLHLYLKYHFRRTSSLTLHVWLESLNFTTQTVKCALIVWFYCMRLKGS